MSCSLTKLHRVAVVFTALLFCQSALAGLNMAASSSDAVKNASVILIIKAKNKNVKPKYKKIGKVKRLVSSEIEVFGRVENVLLGKFNSKTFQGSFAWTSSLNYDARGNEIGNKIVPSLESGEEGSLDEAQSWIVYLDTAGLKPKNGKRHFYRAESVVAKDHLIGLLCKKKKYRSKMPLGGKILCAPTKRAS